VVYIYTPTQTPKMPMSIPTLERFQTMRKKHPSQYTQYAIPYPSPSFLDPLPLSNSNVPTRSHASLPYHALCPTLPLPTPQGTSAQKTKCQIQYPTTTPAIIIPASLNIATLFPDAAMRVNRVALPLSVVPNEENVSD
jgi:hypothetical protein